MGGFDTQALDEATGFDTDLKYSFKDYVLNDKDFITINLYVRMEYCEGTNSGPTLEKALEWRNRVDSKWGFVERNKDGTIVAGGNGVIDRQFNYETFEGILNAVKEIHDKDHVHRDIKPANVFI